jgi:hypothetical protein
MSGLPLSASREILRKKGIELVGDGTYVLEEQKMARNGLNMSKRMKGPEEEYAGL